MAESADGQWVQGPDGAMARNVDLLAYCDLGVGNAGYQMAMQEVDGRFYLYCAHWAKQGISCFEVTDPTAPRFIRFVPEPSGKTGISSVKLQVADGIGILNMQTRKFDMFFGPQPEGTEFDEGLVIWDFSDPESPRLSDGGVWQPVRHAPQLLRRRSVRPPDLRCAGLPRVHLPDPRHRRRGQPRRRRSVGPSRAVDARGPRQPPRRAAHAVHRRRPGLPRLLGSGNGRPGHLRCDRAATHLDAAHPPADGRWLRRRLGAHHRPVCRPRDRGRLHRGRASLRPRPERAPKGSPASATSSIR